MNSFLMGRHYSIFPERRCGATQPQGPAVRGNFGSETTVMGDGHRREDAYLGPFVAALVGGFGEA